MEKLWEHFCNAKLTIFYERKRFCKPSKKFKTELERATVKVFTVLIHYVVIFEEYIYKQKSQQIIVL